MTRETLCDDGLRRHLSLSLLLASKVEPIFAFVFVFSFVFVVVFVLVMTKSLGVTCFRWRWSRSGIALPLSRDVQLPGGGGKSLRSSKVCKMTSWQHVVKK